MMVDKNKQMQNMLLMMSMLNGDGRERTPQEKFKQMFMMMMLMKV